MADRTPGVGIWFALGLVSALLTAVQFHDLLTDDDFVVDLVFFLIALGLTIVFMVRWSHSGHTKPWE